MKNFLKLNWNQALNSEIKAYVNEIDHSIVTNASELEDLLFDDSDVIVFYHLVHGTPMYVVELTEGDYKKELEGIKPNLEGFRHHYEFFKDSEGNDCTEVVYVSEQIIDKI